MPETSPDFHRVGRVQGNVALSAAHSGIDVGRRDNEMCEGYVHSVPCGVGSRGALCDGQQPRVSDVDKVVGCVVADDSAFSHHPATCTQHSTNTQQFNRSV